MRWDAIIKENSQHGVRASGKSEAEEKTGVACKEHPHIIQYGRKDHLMNISLLLPSPGSPCRSVTLPKGIYGYHSQRTSFGVMSLALMISSFAEMLFR